MKGASKDGDETIRWCPQCSGGKQHHAQCTHEDAQFIQAPPKGTIIGGTYLFESVIGVGGMGVVYKCHNWALKRTVALKTLVARQYDTEELVRFQLEAKAAGKLTHPNLVSILDFGITTDGDPFMVMEYLEGKTLENRISDGDLTLIDAVSIVHDCCDALAYAHRHGVTHRDLKPANIMLVSDLAGNKLPKILDFGIAKVADAGKASLHLTQTGSIFGTPPYMSPEQCAGAAITDRSDVYSMGCVLYEAITGCKPFMGKTALETYHLHQTAIPKPLAESRPDGRFDKALEQVILAMMSKRPEERPSIDAVRFELAEVLKEELEREETESQVTEPTSPKKRTSMIWGGAALVGFVCIFYAVTAIKDVMLSNQKSLGIISTNAGLDNAEQNVTQQIPPDTDAFARYAVRATKKQLGQPAMKFRELSFTDEQLDLLAKDRRCVSLSLFQYRLVTAKNFHRLKDMPLKRIELVDTDADNATIAEIASSYKTLTALLLEDCPQISDEGVIQASQLPLTKLSTAEIPITNRAIKAIAGLQLRELYLRDNPNINDESIRLIHHQPLIALILANTSVTRDCLKYVNQMKLMQTLSLDGMKDLQDEDLRLLLNSLPNLQCLMIRRCPCLTDRSVVYLEERIRKADRQYPFRQLWLDETAISAKSIPRLKTMKSLHFLGLQGLHGIGELERNGLRSALPETKIEPRESSGDPLGEVLE